MRTMILAASVLLVAVLAGCIGAESTLMPTQEDDEADGFVPRVIIGIPDTGINPYHELYYRADLTMHPSTYIDGFPADIPAIELSVGGDDWDQMFEADKEIWDAIEEDTWYWIPQTVFVAVYCESGQNADHRGEYCILDDGHMHGTGTTSSALMENPRALLAFKAGGSGIAPFLDGGIPVDVFSVSWGTIVPIPVDLFDDPNAPIYVLSAGNDPRSVILDSWAGDPRNIVVGGAYAAGGTQETLAGQQPDVVSYFCRPTAQTESVSELRESYCGTSFSAPTVAGALSKVILAVRESTGYTGGIDGDHVDPLADFTVGDLRAAMEQTATYDPEPQYPNTGTTAVPLNPVAPWLQWSWGFYDGLVANTTIAHVLGIQDAAEKPGDAHLYMQTVRAVKELLHG